MIVRRMMKTMVAVTGLAAMFVVAACTVPDFAAGSLTINFTSDMSAMKTFFPDDFHDNFPGWDIGQYKIFFTPADGNPVYTDFITENTYTQTDLAPGTCHVLVNGYPTGYTVKIASVEADTEIVSGRETTLEVTLVPVTTDGTFAVELTWPAGSINSPMVEGTLTPQGGEGTSLTFTTGDTGATYSGSQAPGYYTLTLKVYMNDGANPATDLLWGKQDAVLVIGGYTSTATYSSIVQPGALSLTINTNMPADPLSVTLSGNQETIPAGTDMSVSSTCSESGLSYQWYLDGDPLTGEVADSITIGSSLAVGFHTLDLIISKDTRMASAGALFEVTEVALP